MAWLLSVRACECKLFERTTRPILMSDSDHAIGNIRLIKVLLLSYRFFFENRYRSTDLSIFDRSMDGFSIKFRIYYIYQVGMFRMLILKKRGCGCSLEHPLRMRILFYCLFSLQITFFANDFSSFFPSACLHIFFRRQN